jgi:hypothetical protein
MLVFASAPSRESSVAPIFSGELLVDAIERVVRGELNFTVARSQLLSFVDYPSLYLNGLDSPLGPGLPRNRRGQVTAAAHLAR